KSLSFPSGNYVVDAAVHAFGIEAHRIGNAKDNEFSVDQGKQGIGRIAGGDRHIPAQAERVMLIHPGVVARLGAAGTGHTLELRSRKWVESPAFRAVLPRRRQAIERAFA